MEELETIDLKPILNEALKQSMSASEYAELLQAYAVEEKTTGPNQNEDLVYYTKLNAQRSRRITKTVRTLPEVEASIQKLEDQTWILITESWCGDAANSVPVLLKLAELNPGIDLRIVLRDENLELMDRFLTNGGRSIPKLIAINTQQEVQFTWGPRPKEAQELYDNWRNSKDKIPYKDFQVELQKWYNTNKGEALQDELNALIS